MSPSGFSFDAARSPHDCGRTNSDRKDGEKRVGHRLDILLRVNAEESRAVGVSGLQSNQQTTTPFGTGSATGRCGGLLAVTRTEFSFAHQKSKISEDGAKLPVPLSSTVYGVPVLFLPRGRRASVSRVRGIVVLALGSRHVGTPSKDVAFTDCPFRHCLVTWADRLPPEGRFRIRSIQTNSYISVVRPVN